MRHAGVARIVFSSTAAVYGEPQRVPIDETHPTQPVNPYGASKLAVERMLAECSAAYGLRAVSLRYFNAAGADGGLGERHEPETHLIPLVLEAAAGSAALSVFGTDYPTRDGTCVRDYIHVSDLCTAHLLALERMEPGHECFNLGNGEGFTVMEVIEAARRATGRRIEIQLSAPASRRSAGPGRRRNESAPRARLAATALDARAHRRRRLAVRAAPRRLAAYGILASMASCLVLGGAGFVGSHLTAALAQSGQQVKVFERPHVDRLAQLPRKGVEVFTGDLLNPQALIPALRGTETVFHLVSTTLPKSSNDNPAYDVESNVVGGLRLLALCREHGVRKVVFVSSGGTVYGIPKSVPVAEDHPTDPICSYGIHKLALEKYLQLAHRLHGLEYCILRPANLYGPGQRLDTAQGAVAVFSTARCAACRSRSGATAPWCATMCMSTMRSMRS